MNVNFLSTSESGFSLDGSGCSWCNLCHMRLEDAGEEDKSKKILSVLYEKGNKIFLGNLFMRNRLSYF